MTNSKFFKAIAFLITTAVFFSLGFYLYSAVESEEFFLNDGDSYTLEALVVCVPLGLTILWSIIRHRYIWLGAVACLLICTFVSNGIGEDTTPAHVPVFAASIAVPYLLCTYGILFDKKESAPAASTSAYTPSPSSSYTPSSSSSYTPSSAYTDSGSSYSPSSSLSDADKWKYIQSNCNGLYSYGAMSRIDNDPSLSPSQKEELKSYLKVYGD